MTPSVRIAVVDCDASDVAVIASVAGSCALEIGVLAAEEGLVQRLVDQQPVAVVLDVDEENGYALFERVKAEPALAGVPVIFITSLDGLVPRLRAYAAGCDEYLEKPFSRLELAHRLRSFARLRRAWARS